MFSVIGIIFVIVIVVAALNIITADEVHIRLTIDGKDLIKYDKIDKKDGE